MAKLSLVNVRSASALCTRACQVSIRRYEVTGMLCSPLSSISFTVSCVAGFDTVLCLLEGLHCEYGIAIYIDKKQFPCRKVIGLLGCWSLCKMPSSVSLLLCVRCLNALCSCLDFCILHMMWLMNSHYMSSGTHHDLCLQSNGTNTGPGITGGSKMATSTA